MADIDEMSKPNLEYVSNVPNQGSCFRRKDTTYRAPPKVAIMAKKYTLCILGICTGALLSFHILAMLCWQIVFIIVEVVSMPEASQA